MEDTSLGTSERPSEENTTVVFLDETPYSPVVAITSFTVLIFTNVLGNSFTLAAFKRDAKLWTIQNHYILNLCLTDLAVGVGILPFWLSFYTTNWWPLSLWGCKVVVAMDYTLTVESSFTIILLSWDRLMMVMKGAAYSHIQTPRRAKKQIAVTWMLAVLLYTPASLFYDLWTGVNIVPESTCFPEFLYDENFVIFLMGLQFIMTLGIIIGLNVLIFHYIRKQNRTVGPADGSESHVNSRKNKRALRVLFLVVLVFFCCWVPITSLTVLVAIFPQYAPHVLRVEMAVTVLLYTNCSLNPLLYPLASSHFRRNYKAILKCTMSSPLQTSSTGQ